MSMNGIDISGWQPDIDVSKVPADFVIVKATQGTTFTSKSFASQAKATLACGKLLGLYHYVGGGDATGEADWFLKVAGSYVGKAVLCIDWEAEQNSAWDNTAYLKKLVERVIDKSGVRPLIYCSASAFPWALAKELNCGAWVAQYANNNVTGYQDSPWNEGAYSCAIRQYSSHGRLSGYSGNLDLDKAYMGKGAWAKYAKGSGVDSGSSSKGKSVDELANEVIAGKWGNGADRKAALTKAGYDYDAVQLRVNELLGCGTKSVETLANEVIAGKWGNGEDRKKRLKAAGYDYAKVQKRVNELLA